MLRTALTLLALTPVSVASDLLVGPPGSGAPFGRSSLHVDRGDSRPTLRHARRFTLSPLPSGLLVFLAGVESLGEGRFKSRD